MRGTSRKNKQCIHIFLNQKQYRYLEERSAYQQKFMTDIVIEMIEQARLKDGLERSDS